jgi:chromate transporter
VAPAATPVSLLEIAKAFTEVGLLSFGGGTASQILIRKAVVDKRHWMTLADYNRSWQLSKLSLGIQQIAQVIMYGRMFGGWPGVFVGIAGFLVPSSAVTILFSVLLIMVMGNRFVEDALRLIVPLTGGMTMAIALQMWGPSVPAKSRQWFWLFAQGLLVLVCALLVGVVRIPVPLVMAAALCAGALMPR